MSQPGSELHKRVAQLSANEKLILRDFQRLLKAGESPEELGFSEEQLFGGSELESLEQLRSGLNYLVAKSLVKAGEKLRKSYSLDREGEDFAARGLPERRVLERLGASPEEPRDFGFFLKEKVLEKQEIPIAVGWLKRKGLASIQKQDGQNCLRITEKGLTELGQSGLDEKLLSSLAQGARDHDSLDPEEHKALKDLRSRKNLLKEKEQVNRFYQLTQTGSAVLKMGFEIQEQISRLTPDIIKSGSFRNASFQPYDVSLNVRGRPVAKHHPLREIIEEIREIFSNMGFSEFHGDVIVPAFWNMDALFIPQDHPAREMQDTFYLSKPGSMSLEQEKANGSFDIIDKVHQHGGDTGSRGWGKTLDPKESERVLLRTHTTVNTLGSLVRDPKPPRKIFSIGRVFRKEAIDATHLPEFHQVEGVAMEKGANFSMLVGILKDFYAQMGFSRIRLRPAYYPYTEPSMDVEVLWE
jgi:phenylalanyl-tRNA synthetase alpha chain